MNPTSRASRHAALGDERRLRIIDELAISDRTVAELATLVGLPGNLLAHHLDVLESANLVARHVSESDQRRRYVTLQWDNFPDKPRSSVEIPSKQMIFVCSRNSARSQFAAAEWHRKTGLEALSAGRTPASRVHPMAVAVAREFDLDLSDASPSGYESLPASPRMIISVCDKAKETGLPSSSETIHWSVPDPVTVGTKAAFRSTFDEISRRVDRLAEVGA